MITTERLDELEALYETNKGQWGCIVKGFLIAAVPELIAEVRLLYTEIDAYKTMQEMNKK